MNDFIIDVQMLDAGKLISAERYRSCFVTKYTVDQQMIDVTNRLQPWMCFTHYDLPKLNRVADKEGNIVCRIRCCCAEQLEQVNIEFNDRKEVK